MNEAQRFKRVLVLIRMRWELRAEEMRRLAAEEIADAKARQLLEELAQNCEWRAGLLRGVSVAPGS